MTDNQIPKSTRDYEPPKLTEINLLDESVKGFSDEPPLPNPPPQGGGKDERSFERDIDDALGM